MEKNVYTKNGYKDRKEYLEMLSEEYGIDIETVITLSDMLGEIEDFDGLITALDNYAEWLSNVISRTKTLKLRKRNILSKR